jgi:hypothetical protein
VPYKLLTQCSVFGRAQIMVRPVWPVVVDTTGHTGRITIRSGRLRKTSPPTGIRSPDRADRNQSLYRLSYPGQPRITQVKIAVHFGSAIFGASLLKRWPNSTKATYKYRVSTSTQTHKKEQSTENKGTKNTTYTTR